MYWYIFIVDKIIYLETMYLANSRVCNTDRTFEKTKKAQVYKDIPIVHTSEDTHLIHRVKTSIETSLLFFFLIKKNLK